MMPVAPSATASLAFTQDYSTHGIEEHDAARGQRELSTRLRTRGASFACIPFGLFVDGCPHRARASAAHEDRAE